MKSDFTVCDICILKNQNLLPINRATFENTLKTSCCWLCSVVMPLAAFKSTVAYKSSQAR